MIEHHNCPHCRREMKMWLPLKIIKPSVVKCGCGNEVDFSFVYASRELLKFEEIERKQLRYLMKKYDISN